MSALGSKALGKLPERQSFKRVIYDPTHQNESATVIGLRHTPFSLSRYQWCATCWTAVAVAAHIRRETCWRAVLCKVHMHGLLQQANMRHCVNELRIE
ncbi:hypothetical protein LIA77_03261 [Sarocladium implicatum]|nr:hypothetical protein LIA77_03261 [Sarocladium implicatum]